MIDRKIEFSNPEPPETDDIRDALFGSDLDIEEEDLGEILALYNLSAETIVTDFKALLQDRIRMNESGDPQEKENLLLFLRDITNYQRARSPESVEPKSWVRSLIDNTNKTSFPAQNAYAYRGRENDEDAEADKELIQELESELDRDE